MEDSQRRVEHATEQQELRKGLWQEHRAYHRFTEEFKREAVRLSQQSDRTVAGDGFEDILIRLPGYPTLTY